MLFLIHWGSHMNKYIGNRKFNLLVISIAIPIMLQNLVTTSVNLVDSLMVGQLGDAAIGGVAAVNRYFMIMNYGALGVINAVGIFIAQYFGAENEQKMKESFRFSVSASYLIILPFFFAALFFPRQILHFFTDDVLLINVGVEYLQVVCLTYLPLGASLAISSAMRCIGETKIPLAVSVLSVLTNTFFNYCLIFGNFGFPRLGVSGAAIATLIARIVELTVLLYIMKRRHFPFASKVSELHHIPFSLIKIIAFKAAPLCLNELLWSGGNAMMLKLYGTRGSHVLSGYAITTTMTDIFYTLFAGMAVATTVMVSQQLGANHLKEAKENGYHMVGFSFFVSLLFAGFMYLISFTVPFLYGSASTEVISTAQNMIHVQSICFILYTLNTQNYFIVRAGGDTKSTLIMDSGFMWLFTIPLLSLIAYLTSIDIYIMYLVGQTSELLKLMLSTRLLHKEKWVVNLTKV